MGEGGVSSVGCSFTKGLVRCFASSGIDLFLESISFFFFFSSLIFYHSNCYNHFFSDSLGASSLSDLLLRSEDSTQELKSESDSDMSSMFFKIDYLLALIPRLED